MRTRIFFAGYLPMVAALACGSSGSTAPPADTSTVKDFQALALQVQSSFMVYGDAMAIAPTQEACRVAHDQYDSRVRPQVIKMAATSKGMDAFMDTHAGDMVSDVSCAVDGMVDELDRHAAQACSSMDASVNREEVNRHVGAMAAYDAHLQNRCDTMMQAGSGPLTWGPMMQGCQYWFGQ